MDSNNFDFYFINIDISNYTYLFAILVFVTMLILFLRKRVKTFMNNRKKLKEMAEDYERKRKSRKSLRVKD